MKRLTVCALALLGAAVPPMAVTPASAASVLLISIDARSPDYVTKADSLGLKIPNLRRFLCF